MDAGEVTDAYKVYRRRLSDGSDAERQRRWREGRNALARSHPDVVEQELLQAAGRCERLWARSERLWPTSYSTLRVRRSTIAKPEQTLA